MPASPTPRIVVAALATLVVLAPAAPAHASFPGGNGAVVFSAGKRLWVMNPAGGAATRLIAAETNQGQAAWAPDGSRIAFRQGPDGDSEIWVVNADGTGLRQVTDTPNPAPTDRRFASQPSWSPDGREIVFRSDRRDATNADLWIVGADGSNLRSLVETPGNERYGSISPDGTRLVYRTDVDGDPDLYLARADGSGAVALTNTPEFESAPAWSPDGRRIAFERGAADAGTNSSPAYATMELWTMSASGGDEQQLTANGLHDEGPAWAPDGSGAMVFAREEAAGNSGLWIRDPSGVERRLADGASSEESPDWQPLPAGASPAKGTGKVAATPPPAPALAVLSKRVRVSRTGVLALRVRSAAGYRGAVSMTRGAAVLARRPGVRVAAGKTAIVRLRLSRRTLRLLRVRGILKIVVRPSKTSVVLLPPRRA